MVERLLGRRRAEAPDPIDPPADFYSPRELTYVTPVGRRLSDYEASICQNQPDFGQYDSGGWYLLSPEGRALFDEGTTALRHPNWFDYRDPSTLWQRTYVRQQAEQERAIAAALETARMDDAFADVDSAWACDILARYYEAWGCAEWGLFLAYTYPVREALSDTLTMAFVFAAVDHLRHQQAIGLYSLDLEDEVLGYRSGLGPDTWISDAALQPSRRVVEGLMATDDWGEMVIVTALLFEPLLSAFVTSQFLRRHAALNGDILTPAIILTAERDRARNRAATVALVELLLGPSDRKGRPVPAGHNRDVLQDWIDHWAPLVLEAVDAFVPVFDLPPARGPSAAAARERVVAGCHDLLCDAGLELPGAAS
ncbi:MAG: monooxygenase [Actinomycetota bacterium]